MKKTTLSDIARYLIFFASFVVVVTFMKCLLCAHSKFQNGEIGRKFGSEQKKNQVFPLTWLNNYRFKRVTFKIDQKI